MKSFLHLASPICTFVGLLLSVWGSYRLMRYYQPYRTKLEFWKSFQSTTWLTVRFRRRALRRRIKLEARAARGRKENRVDSVFGTYLLFWGFTLQVFGAMFWIADSIIDIVVQ